MDNHTPELPAGILLVTSSMGKAAACDITVVTSLLCIRSTQV